MFRFQGIKQYIKERNGKREEDYKPDDTNKHRVTYEVNVNNRLL